MIARRRHRCPDFLPHATAAAAAAAASAAVPDIAVVAAVSQEEESEMVLLATKGVQRGRQEEEAHVGSQNIETARSDKGRDCFIGSL